MAFGDKGVVDSVIGALVGANRRTEEAGASLSSEFADKLFGPTAESADRNAEEIAPAASTEPTTVGRRSKPPGGYDAFHASADSSMPDEQA